MDEDEHSFYLEFLTEEADFWKEVKKKRTREIDPCEVGNPCSNTFEW